MDDVVAMQVSDATDHLPEVERGEVFLKIVLLADLFKEASVGDEFKQQVDFVGIVKKAIHLEDVGMVGVQLDLDLLHQLRLHARCPHLSLADHLDRTGETGIDVPAHVHVAEFAAAQLAPHLEHAQAQLLVFVGAEDTAEIEKHGLVGVVGVFPAGKCVAVAREEFLGLFVELSFVFLLNVVLIGGFVGLDSGLIHALAHNFLLDILDRYGSDCFFLGTRQRLVIFPGNLFLGGVGIVLGGDICERLEDLIGVARLVGGFFIGFGAVFSGFLDGVDHGIDGGSLLGLELVGEGRRERLLHFGALLGVGSRTRARCLH